MRAVTTAKSMGPPFTSAAGAIPSGLLMLYYSHPGASIRHVYSPFCLILLLSSCKTCNTRQLPGPKKIPHGEHDVIVNYNFTEVTCKSQHPRRCFRSACAVPGN